MHCGPLRAHLCTASTLHLTSQCKRGSLLLSGPAPAAAAAAAAPKLLMLLLRLLLQASPAIMPACTSGMRCHK
jgi:hypothetical protein